jgi:hypothetical protein
VKPNGKRIFRDAVKSKGIPSNPDERSSKLDILSQREVI